MGLKDGFLYKQTDEYYAFLSLLTVWHANIKGN